VSLGPTVSMKVKKRGGELREGEEKRGRGEERDGGQRAREWNEGTVGGERRKGGGSTMEIGGRKKKGGGDGRRGELGKKPLVYIPSSSPKLICPQPGPRTGRLCTPVNCPPYWEPESG